MSTKPKATQLSEISQFASPKPLDESTWHLWVDTEEARGSPSVPPPAKAEGERGASPQMLEGVSLAANYPRLLLALRDATPGDLIFVQLNSPEQRRRLPEQLAADGLPRPFAVADFATFYPGPPPHGVLREFLEDLQSTPPEILFVDGLEHWIDADPKTLEALNLGRERLASLGVVVVFLLPAYIIDLIRTRALNLWSWRAHHYSLEPTDPSTTGR